MKKDVFFLFLLAVSTCLQAKVSMPGIFGDNMVLQRNKPISIWGWAAANEKVSVQFNNQYKTTKADKFGNWQILLNPEQAGGPYQLIIQGKNKLQFLNIVVGEVWFCSGQSNMEMPIAGNGRIDNYVKELSEAKYPLIREFKTRKTVSVKEEANGVGEWKICTPETAGEFSAVAYFFARELYKNLGVPVGIINSSWGGTQIEPWIALNSLEQHPDFTSIAKALKEEQQEEIIKGKAAATLKRIQEIAGTIGGSDIKQWMTTDYNDGAWRTIQVPGLWESQRLSNFDGVVWYRKSIVVTENNAGKPAVIVLAEADDDDETYINGVKVGATRGWDVKRKYIIPAGVLKEGRNSIAVKVTDYSAGGGLYGNTEDIKIVFSDSSMTSLAGSWKYKIGEMFSSSGSTGPNEFPGVLYNSMVHPFINYTIKGFLWYQGESNASRAYQYRTVFPFLINDWRKRWKDQALPFYFVQLSSFGSANANSNTGSTWAELRESQSLTLTVPHTGMAVTTDIGNATDIHPKNKQDVGKRLAAIAMHDLYGKKETCTGPLYQSMEAEGNNIILTFSNTDSGWLVKDKYGYIKGFEIAGADQQFHFAMARVVDDNRIIVFSKAVQQPIAVRYNWYNEASEGNVYNTAGFPLAPFRTDNWKLTTADKKYSIN